MAEENVVKLNIDSLIPNPYQPRKTFNENSLKELALSIREYGILNPILVRPKDDKYEIIAGERRTRAAKLLNLDTVPVIIKDISDDKMAEIALIENIQRENITPIEEAMTYQTILKKTNKTEKELSEIIGRSQPYIANKIRLLTLPENIKEALINKKISERHARSLLTVKDENRQTNLLEKIINEKLTVKELDKMIKKEEITDDEIHSTVNNIMKSLDSSENKEEEKESDNMNNGNFFPNFNSTPVANNNQASLNSMNMQTMNNGFTYQPEQNNVQEAPIVQEPVTPLMPEQPIPQIENQVNNMVAETPLPTPPILNGETTVPTQDLTQMQANVEIPTIAPVVENPLQTPEPNQTMANVPEPPVIEEQPQPVDIPLFTSQENTTPVAPMVTEQAPVEVVPQIAPLPTEPTAPLLQPEMAPAMPEQPIPQMEVPLFNQELAAPSVEVTPQLMEQAPVENGLESPVPTETVDRFTEVTQLLNNNGVQYKAYSNETGHCIIIEL